MNNTNKPIDENNDESRMKINSIRKPCMNDSSNDELFHLALNNTTHDFKSLFGDVKFVCMGGTVHRMKQFAQFIGKEIASLNDSDLIDLTDGGHRFSMFKVGGVLCINHGIGYGSITIVLHEIIKLLHYAGVHDGTIFRIGTSGGFQAPSGSVVIAERVYNDFLEEVHEVAVLGQKVKFPAIINQGLCTKLKEISKSRYDFPIISGKVMSHENFYESVASKNGAICTHSNEEREKFYKLLLDNDILCADMEATAMGYITHMVGIKTAIVNAVVNNIVHPSKDAISSEILKEWQTRPQKVVAEYIKQFYLNRK